LPLGQFSGVPTFVDIRFLLCRPHNYFRPLVMGTRRDETRFGFLSVPLVSRRILSRGPGAFGARPAGVPGHLVHVSIYYIETKKLHGLRGLPRLNPHTLINPFCFLKLFFLPCLDVRLSDPIFDKEKRPGGVVHQAVPFLEIISPKQTLDA
jgi:hypothetical protein